MSATLIWCPVIRPATVTLQHFSISLSSPVFVVNAIDGGAHKLNQFLLQDFLILYYISIKKREIFHLLDVVLHVQLSES